jgi:hypothetical protein
MPPGLKCQAGLYPAPGRNVIFRAVKIETSTDSSQPKRSSSGPETASRLIRQLMVVIVACRFAPAPNCSGSVKSKRTESQGIINGREGYGRSCISRYRANAANG